MSLQPSLFPTEPATPKRTKRRRLVPPTEGKHSLQLWRDGWWCAKHEAGRWYRKHMRAPLEAPYEPISTPPVGWSA